MKPCVIKCDCEECGGTGMIECPDCDGAGQFELDLASGGWVASHEHEEELRELQKDLKRVRREAEQLTALRPDRAASYQVQLEEAVRGIMARAAELVAA